MFKQKVYISLFGSIVEGQDPTALQSIRVFPVDCVDNKGGEWETY